MGLVNMYKAGQPKIVLPVDILKSLFKSYFLYMKIL